jgi:DNA-binding MarR family transcriptional regulator
MTHTLAGLDRAGLIRFAPNPKDGRSKCVMLTEGGRAFRDEAIVRMGPDLRGDRRRDSAGPGRRRAAAARGNARLA